MMRSATACAGRVQVLNADRPGRKIAIIGPSIDSLVVARHAAEADVVLHSTTKLVSKVQPWPLRLHCRWILLMQSYKANLTGYCKRSLPLWCQIHCCGLRVGSRI